MTRLFDLQNSLNPSNDLMGRWVRWLVEVDDSILLKDVNWSVQWRVSTWKWGEMVGLDVQFIVVLNIFKLAKCSLKIEC